MRLSPKDVELAFECPYLDSKIVIIFSPKNIISSIG